MQAYQPRLHPLLHNMVQETTTAMQPLPCVAATGSVWPCYASAMSSAPCGPCTMHPVASWGGPRGPNTPGRWLVAQLHNVWQATGPLMCNSMSRLLHRHQLQLVLYRLPVLMLLGSFQSTAHPTVQEWSYIQQSVSLWPAHPTAPPNSAEMPALLWVRGPQAVCALVPPLPPKNTSG
jgi:hypothetical protein